MHARERRSRETRETRAAAQEEKERLPAYPGPMKYALVSQRKIRLADARGIDIKLSTIKTIDKLLMAEALQEYLSRFPKIETLKAQQRETLESPFSGRDVIAILPTGFGKSAISHARGHLCVLRFARRTAEKREIARGLSAGEKFT